MQCRNCGSPIPAGVAFCQQCGTPVNPPLTPSSLPPTVAASQPSYGKPDPNAYTNYNPPSMPGNGQTDGTTQNPYANNAYNLYAQPQPNNVPLYSPPPQPGNATIYASPPQPNNMGTPAFAGPVPVPVKPKSKVGLVAGIVIAVLVIVIVAILLIPKSSVATGKGPSGTAIDSAASSIITNIQMASAVDTSTYQPTTLATNFKTYTDIYSTFQFDITNTNVSQQNPGYVVAKFYIQNRFVLADNVLKVDNSVAPSGHGYGYFAVKYYHATTDGSVEIYWCRQSDCSDGKLAQTTTFTVS